MIQNCKWTLFRTTTGQAAMFYYTYWQCAAPPADIPPASGVDDAFMAEPGN